MQPLGKISLQLAAFLFGLGGTLPAFAQQFNNLNTPPLVTLTAAGAGTTDSPDQVNYFGRGVQLGINISAKTGTISVTVAVQGKDAASGAYYPICTSAALTAAAFTNMTVYPGITAVTNLACPYPLPATWRVEVVSGTGTTPAVTLTIGASIIL